MGIVIVLAMGALLGWAGSILLRVERRDDVVALILTGAIGAIALAGLVTGVDLFLGLEARQIASGLTGGILGTAIGFAVRRAPAPADAELHQS